MDALTIALAELAIESLRTSFAIAVRAMSIEPSLSKAPFAVITPFASTNTWPPGLIISSVTDESSSH